MTSFLLDTDHLSLLERGHPQITARIDQALDPLVKISIITVEEQLRGRFARIRAARNEAELLRAFHWLHETVSIINDFQILDYDFAASRIYTTLRQQKIRIGTADLRIAAIALAHNCTLVTRNQIDFGQIPDLVTEDWSK
jgi:tRNA(fMet)-specific endonuclease VapC